MSGENTAWKIRNAGADWRIILTCVSNCVWSWWLDTSASVEAVVNTDCMKRWGILYIVQLLLASQKGLCSSRVRILLLLCECRTRCHWKGKTYDFENRVLQKTFWLILCCSDIGIELIIHLITFFGVGGVVHRHIVRKENLPEAVFMSVLTWIYIYIYMYMGVGSDRTVVSYWTKLLFLWQLI